MGEAQMGGGNFAALGERVGRLKTAIACGQPCFLCVGFWFWRKSKDRSAERHEGII